MSTAVATIIAAMETFRLAVSASAALTATGRTAAMIALSLTCHPLLFN